MKRFLCVKKISRTLTLTKYAVYLDVVDSRGRIVTGRRAATTTGYFLAGKYVPKCYRVRMYLV